MARVPRLFAIAGLIVLMVLAFGAGWLAGALRYGVEVPRESLTELERAFAERMSGASMIGVFTVDGRTGGAPRADRYHIERVEKVGDDLWRFTARIGYGGAEAAVPVVVTMRWVGDTPMVTLTDVTVPGMGTFTVRLFYYGDRYAGIWQNEQGTGGQMYGRLELPE